MILGFLGKGGSGKSSVATQMALLLNFEKKKVLAIDADHNMDLSYNLSYGSHVDIAYLSGSMDELARAVGLKAGQKYTEAFLHSTEVRFRLQPLSTELENFSALLPSKIRLMTCGPQTDIVLFGQACSHSLSTPLKLLLPLMELNTDEVVVVDEKAGADGVTTGIVTGIDVGVIVCEPSLHSIKTAKQIAELMQFYKTPYLFVGNKVASSEDRDFITERLGETPITFLLSSDSIKRHPSNLVSEWRDELIEIYNQALKQNKNNRIERTAFKFERNKQYEHDTHP